MGRMGRMGFAGGDGKELGGGAVWGEQGGVGGEHQSAQYLLHLRGYVALQGVREFKKSVKTGLLAYSPGNPCTALGSAGHFPATRSQAQLCDDLFLISRATQIGNTLLPGSLYAAFPHAFSLTQHQCLAGDSHASTIE